MNKDEKMICASILASSLIAKHPGEVSTRDAVALMQEIMAEMHNAEEAKQQEKFGEKFSI